MANTYQSTAPTVAAVDDVWWDTSTTPMIWNICVQASPVVFVPLTQSQIPTKTYRGRTSAGTGPVENVAIATVKTDLVLVKADVGLGSVDNTSDASKPISTAEQAQLNLKANLTSPALVTPNIGAAVGTSLALTGAMTSSGGGIGYAAGAGGAVTQLTSRVTGVSLSKLSGTITMFSAAVAAAASSSFVLTNTFIAATDYVLVKHESATNAAAWQIETVPAAGSCTIIVKNISAASITEATPLKFIILKGVTS